MTATPERTIPPLRTIREVKPGSFIFERPSALPPSFCDAVIERFESHPEHQYAGRVGQLRAEDPGVKRTTDLVVSNKPDWKDVDEIFFRSLAAAIKEFRETYPYFKGPFKDEGYQVQRYRPGEFYHWHVDGGSHELGLRQLVA
ncbi:MAG: 2OG-Fe(II) oxygenase, partial [Thiocapsa sp.]